MLTCTACRRLTGGPFDQRVYADALVLVLLGRNERGQRALWVLPRSHGSDHRAGQAALNDHLFTVARRAGAALREAGIEFSLEGARLGHGAADGGHPHLEVPELPMHDDTGVHRLPPRPPARVTGVGSHLEWAKPLQTGRNSAKDGTGSGVSDGTKRQPRGRSGR